MNKTLEHLLATRKNGFLFVIPKRATKSIDDTVSDLVEGKVVESISQLHQMYFDITYTPTVVYVIFPLHSLDEAFLFEHCNLEYHILGD